MSNNERKAVDPKGIQKGVQEKFDNLTPAAQAEYFKGINNGALIEGKPRYKQAGAEKVICDGAIIVGRDRPGSMASGYGGTGDTACDALSLTVGRASPQNLGGYINMPGKGQQRLVVNPDNRTDAAMMNLSQKGNMHQYFNLAPGKGGEAIAKSFAVMKADSIACISREGMSFHTRTDKANSQDGDVSAIGNIDLCAGNDKNNLQPLVKGDNLVEALLGIVEHIDRLSGVVDSFVEYQNAFNNAVTHHTHWLPNNVQELTWDEVGYNMMMKKGFKMETKPSRFVQSEGQKCAMNLFSSTKTSAYIGRVNTGNFRDKYNKSWGGKFINSRWTNTT